MSMLVRASVVACALAGMQCMPSWVAAQDVPDTEPASPLPIAPAPVTPSTPGEEPEQLGPRAEEPSQAPPVAAEDPSAPAVGPAEAPPPQAPPSADEGTEVPATTSTQAGAPVPAPEDTRYSLEAHDNRSYVDSDVRGRDLPNRSLLSGGATLLLTAYLPSVIVAGAKDWSGDHYLYYPVAGPWLYLKRRTHDPGGRALLIVDGLVQDMGALHMLVSFVLPERPRESRWQRHVENSRFQVMPRFARQRDARGQSRGMLLGLTARGRF